MEKYAHLPQGFICIIITTYSSSATQKFQVWCLDFNSSVIFFDIKVVDGGVIFTSKLSFIFLYNLIVIEGLLIKIYYIIKLWDN